MNYFKIVIKKNNCTIILLKDNKIKNNMLKNNNKSFCDLKRKENIETILNELKLKPIDISDDLLTYNELHLNKNVCEKLLSIIPNDSEYNEISKKTETFDNEEDFALCDLFIVLLGCICCNKERLEAIIFKNIYSEQCIKILGLIDTLFKGFELIKNDDNFHKYLDILFEQMNGIKKYNEQKFKLWNFDNFITCTLQ